MPAGLELHLRYCCFFVGYRSREFNIPCIRIFQSLIIIKSINCKNWVTPMYSMIRRKFEKGTLHYRSERPGGNFQWNQRHGPMVVTTHKNSENLCLEWHTSGWAECVGGQQIIGVGFVFSYHHQQKKDVDRPLFKRTHRKALSRTDLLLRKVSSLTQFLSSD